MPVKLKKGVKDLVAEANAEIDIISVDDALNLQEDANTQFVDIRDVRELGREGTIPGAFHCPRGLLEFWVDPESPYHKDIFASGKKFIFFCQSSWRSALATQSVQRMGLAPVAHMEGGLTAWKEAGGPVEAREKKKG